MNISSHVCRRKFQGENVVEDRLLSSEANAKANGTLGTQNKSLL